MIIQTLLDWYTSIIVGFVQLVPPLPADLSNALRLTSNAGTSLAPKVAAFGVVVPFEVINGCIQAWVGLVAWWFSMVLLRVVVWVAGR